MAEMIKLTKDKFIPFIDVSGTINKEEWVPVWKRVDYSTIFSLNPNPQTTETDYICYEAAITTTDSYKPELPQEIAIYEGNPVYDFMFEKFYNLEVGPGMNLPVLMCFGGSAKKAWQLKDATVTLGELNTVDGKLSFTLNMGGAIDRGTYAVTEGVPTFTPAAS
jgi:hypothetical protein